MSYNDDGIFAPVKMEVLADWLLRHAELYQEWPSKTKRPKVPGKTNDNWYKLHQKTVDDYDPDTEVLFKIESLEKPIDSSKMIPEQWFDIAKRIAEVQEGFDGFVILHGTDTMAYTASALSFILKDLKKPVILTGAQRTIFHPRSNAIDNYMGSMLIASCFSSCKHLQRVMLYDNTTLYQGNRVRKTDSDSFSVFSCPNFEPLLKLKSVIRDKCVEVIKCRPATAKTPEKITVNIPRIKQSEVFPDVRILKFFPGIKAEYMSSLLSGAHGVVLETFGSGNIPEDPGLIKVLKAADDRGVIIMNCTQVFRGTVQPIYDAQSPLWKLTVPGFDITPEAALAKMIWVIQMIPDKETRKKVLESSICGESSAPVRELEFRSGK